MKILSFDIEEWFIEKTYKGDRDSEYQTFDITLERVLDLLDKHSAHATFFCLGSLADSFPDVLKKIAGRGHEIGCHSHLHKWVNKMTPDEFLEDTLEAVRKLEECTGKKVKSYRAPAFSIGESNKWAFKILHQCGIENDASIFPCNRDFGGFPTFSGGAKPCKVIHDGISLNEFPISMTHLPIIGKKTAYSGGGYFRLLPLRFVRSCMNSTDYVMCYFHIMDLIDKKSDFKSRKEYEDYFKESGTLIRRITRYLKSNIGRKRTFKGLETILREFDFISVEEAAAKSLHFPEVTV